MPRVTMLHSSIAEHDNKRNRGTSDKPTTPQNVIIVCMCRIWQTYENFNVCHLLLLPLPMRLHICFCLKCLSAFQFNTVSVRISLLNLLHNYVNVRTICRCQSLPVPSRSCICLYLPEACLLLLFPRYSRRFYASKNNS